MPGLLVETDSSSAAGFGARPGFGFGWGNGFSALNTWSAPILNFEDVGDAFFGLGCFTKDYGGSIGAFGKIIAAVDYLNLDGQDFGPGYLSEAYAQWAMGLAGGSPADGYFTAEPAPPNVVPFLLGGNDLKTVISAFYPGYDGGGGGGVTVVGDNTIVTGLGFQPDLVIFLGASSDNASGTNGLRTTIGMMDANGNQWADAELGVFLTGPTLIGALYGSSVRMGEFRSDACFLTMPDPYGNETAPMSRNQFSFVSMDSDGFTIQQDVGGPYFAVTWYAAFKINDPTKGFFQVGTHVQGDTSLGDYPLDPEGVLLCGHNWSDSIDGTPPPIWTDAPSSTRAVLSLGGFDAVTNRSTVGGAGSGTGGPEGNPGMYYDDSAIVFANVGSQTIQARALGSLGTLTASLDWTDDDGGARPFGSLAFRCPNKLFPALNNRIPAERP